MIPPLNVGRLVDACYAAVVDERAWACGLVGALEPLAGDLGVHALRWERCRSDAVALLASTTAAPAGLAAISAATPVSDALFGGRAVELLSWRVASAPRAAASTLRRFVQSLRAADVLLVRGEDGGSIALVLAVPIARARTVAPAVLRALRPFAEHLSSALRLRQCLADGRAGANAADGGRRGVLAESARREARRSGQPIGANGAIALWEGLLAGRWSVVDWRTDAAPCTLLLRPAGPHDPRALTRREGAVVSRAALGQSNKEIAYALGIGETTVATHLCVATEKLRLPSRCALIALFAPSCGPATTLVREGFRATEGEVIVH